MQETDHNRERLANKYSIVWQAVYRTVLQHKICLEIDKNLSSSNFTPTSFSFFGKPQNEPYNLPILLL